MSKGSKTTTESADPWGPAQSYLKSALGDVSNAYSSGALNTTYNQQVAGLTDAQKQILNGTISNATTNNSDLTSIINSLKSTATGADTSGNWDTISQNVINDVTPTINSSFAGSGMTGSTAHANALSSGLSNGLATAKTAYDQQQYDNQLSASNAISALQGVMGNNTSAAQTAANAYQTQNQNVLDANYQNSLQNQASDDSALQNYISLLTALSGQGSSATSSQSQSLGLMGVLGTGAGIASLFSDRRLKTDIKRVGCTDDGLPIYTYRYKGGSRVHMGIMAQDVQAVKPEAVADMGGYLGVNYEAL